MEFPDPGYYTVEWYFGSTRIFRLLHYIEGSAVVKTDFREKYSMSIRGPSHAINFTLTVHHLQLEDGDEPYYCVGSDWSPPAHLMVEGK